MGKADRSGPLELHTRVSSGTTRVKGSVSMNVALISVCIGVYVNECGKYEGEFVSGKREGRGVTY